jgi:hypothetical protein
LILATLFLAGCATHVEVMPAGGHQAASSQITRLWWREDSRNRGVIYRRPLFKTRWSALVRPAETSRPHRLYLMEPYAPDRIPVIMVHGLRSTPLVWEELTNELMGDRAGEPQYL